MNKLAGKILTELGENAKKAALKALLDFVQYKKYFNAVMEELYKISINPD